MARRTVVRLGVPAVIVAVLAVAALWRIGLPPQPRETTAVATTGSPANANTTPVKTIAELVSNNAVGREASLEHVRIRDRVGDRFYWIGSGDERPVFVVLDPDIKRTTTATLQPGTEVTLIGIVRPAPTAQEAERQWHLPASTATLIADSATYLHATEIRP